MMKGTFVMLAVCDSMWWIDENSTSYLFGCLFTVIRRVGVSQEIIHSSSLYKSVFITMVTEHRL